MSENDMSNNRIVVIGFVAGLFAIAVAIGFVVGIVSRCMAV